MTEDGAQGAGVTGAAEERDGVEGGREPGRYSVRTYAAVEGSDRSGLPDQIARQRRRVAERMEEIDRVLAVMSGKGGVGKSFVAAGVAAALRSAGCDVGLLDADLDAPTGARLLGGAGASLEVAGEEVHPAPSPSGVRFVSTALLLGGDAPLRWTGPDRETHVWRGSQEHGLLREFLADVAWGRLDVLVVDLPPGSHRLEQLAGLVPARTGAVAVTLPSAAAASAVARSLSLARELDVPVLGVVENMSGYLCGSCGRHGPLFPGDAGRELASEFGVPLLGRIPFDAGASRLADGGEVGRWLRETAAGEALRAVVGSLLEGREAGSAG